MDGNRDEQIRKRAREIWESAGKPEGQDREHWARAERELDGASAGPEAAANPVGNGQGDAQADDPNNAMNGGAANGGAEGAKSARVAEGAQSARVGGNPPSGKQAARR
jgi:hypothetical protein